MAIELQLVQSASTSAIDRVDGLQDERRVAPRFEVAVPVKLKLENGVIHTTTDDLSSHGVQFSIDEEHEPHLPDTVELTVTLSADVTLSVPREVWCQAKVIRKIRSQIKRVAIAAKIEDYRHITKGEA